MKRFFKYVFILVLVAFSAQWGYTGSVSPPVTLWPDKAENGDYSTVSPEFDAIDFDDSTTLTSSPESCAGNQVYNNLGCVTIDPAQDDFDMNGFSIVDADTVGVNTGYDYPDGSQQVTAYRSQSNLPLTEIPAGDTASIRLTVPSSKTMNLVRLGIQSDTGSSLNNLEVEVDTDNDGSSVTDSTTSTSTTSSDTISSSSDVIIRMDNNRSDTKSASAFVEYRYE